MRSTHTVLSTEGAMNLTPIRNRLPVAVALMFFALAFGRPAQRGVWLGIGVIFLVLGLRRRKAAPPTDGSSGV
jgi:hypothetical protein